MSSEISYSPPKAKVTSDDVEKVRRYVNAGLTLPLTLESINSEFHGSVNEGGITASDLLVTFDNIHNHAEKWSPLETQIIKVSSSLKRFASDLKANTQPALDEVQAIEGYNDYKLKTTDLTVEQIQNFKVPLSTSGPQVDDTYETINEYVKLIIGSIQDKQNIAAEVKTQLVDFDATLDRIEQDVGHKANIALASKTLEELRDITAKLITVNNQLSNLRSESKYSVGEWFMFATLILPVIGVPLCGAYFGVRDANYNAKITELNHQESTLLARQAELQKVASVLNSIHSGMVSLKIFTKGAVEGLMQIETLWSNTLTEITAAKNALSGTRDFSLLVIFVIKMTDVLSRWKNIQDNMNNMSAAFGQRN